MPKWIEKYESLGQSLSRQLSPANSGRLAIIGSLPRVPRACSCHNRPPQPSNAIRPLTVNFPDEEITDLRRRIAATRWPEKETVADPSQGVQLATMQALARYWASEHDWRKCEAKINAVPNFITEIDGLAVGINTR